MSKQMIIQTAEFEAGHVAVRCEGSRIHEVALGETPGEAIASLGDSGQLVDTKELARLVIAAWQGRAQAAGFSLVQEGTELQLEVWRVLQGLPAGSVLSYGELAAMVGRPRAVRAVASACARNRHALVVPCHRIVHRDGPPGAYRWGSELKSRLLSLEAQMTERC